MPEVSVGAPVLFIEKRPDLLAQAQHDIRFSFGTSFRAVWDIHRLRELPGDAGCELLHEGRGGVTMKYLATLAQESHLQSQVMIFLGFMNIGGQEVFLILLIILLLFGAKKLPELARGMGSALKEFQKAKDEFSDELHKTDTAAAKPDVRSPTATVPRIETAPTASASESQRAPDQTRVSRG